MAEQRYQAVLGVIADGRDVKEVAAQWGVSRQTVHAWLAKYESGGLDGLADRSHRPRSCPHQMPGEVEAAVLELRRTRPYWGPRRIAWEVTKRGVAPAPSASAVYRALLRAGLVESQPRHRRAAKWRRWERSRPMELWQMDTVGGFLLADGSHAKALTGVDDHSRYCVSAVLMPRERTQTVCQGLASALRRYGVPEQILTDNGKVFTGRFHHPPVEVLFDRICRENGVEHLLTQPRSPTTTGKIERFHRTLRAEFDTTRVFATLATAQGALDEWVSYYNEQRPHQALDYDTPGVRFAQRPVGATGQVGQVATSVRPVPDRDTESWVARKVCSNGIVCVSWQQVSVGKHRAGQRCDVLVTPELLQFWIEDELLKTVKRRSTGEVRKKYAAGTGKRA